MSLKQKTIKGLSWSALAQGGKVLSQFIVTMILARLLAPSDFGLLAMATVFANFAMIFSEMGISSALIQKQDAHDRHYYSAFWFNVAVGIFLTLVFVVCSPLIAWFYKKPQLQPILMVISVNFFLSSFGVIQQTILTKEMDFKKLAVRDIVAVVASGIVGIYLAYHGFGVWSLVYQLIAYTLFSGIILWTVSPWRPKLVFAMQDIKDIFNFSANLTGFNIINYFARNIDQLLIGKFLGAQALGYYSLAYKIMLYPLQNISAVIGRVMFPAFSKMQNDLEKIRNNYLKMIKAISLISFPLMVVLFVLAPEFVRAVYGPHWEPLIILIRIFCFCGMTQSINTTVGNILLSQGRADLQLKLGILGAFFVLVAVLLGLRWGIVGVTLFYTVEQFFWAIFVQRVANSIVLLDNKQFLLSLKDAMFMGLFLLSIFLVKIVFVGSNILIFGFFLGLVAYIGLLFIFKEISFQSGRLKINILID